MARDLNTKGLYSEWCRIVNSKGRVYFTFLSKCCSIFQNTIPKHSLFSSNCFRIAVTCVRYCVYVMYVCVYVCSVIDVLIFMANFKVSRYLKEPEFCFVEYAFPLPFVQASPILTHSVLFIQVFTGSRSLSGMKCVYEIYVSMILFVILNGMTNQIVSCLLPNIVVGFLDLTPL